MNDSCLTSMRVATLAMAMFVGCAGNTETAPDSDPQVDNSESQVDRSEPESVVSETPAASAEDEGTAKLIPDSFPEDIFVAEGREVIDFKEMGGKMNLILNYPATDIDEFIKSFQDGMAAQGWTVVASSKLPIGTLTNFSKDDRKCTISIGEPKDNVIKVAVIF